MDVYRLSEFFRYCPEDGSLRWKVDKGRAREGQIAGKVKRGKMIIKVDGREYQAHRLVWAMHRGNYDIAGRRIRPINGDWLDTRIENLELCNAELV